MNNKIYRVNFKRSIVFIKVYSFTLTKVNISEVITFSKLNY